LFFRGYTSYTKLHVFLPDNCNFCNFCNFCVTFRHFLFFLLRLHRLHRLHNRKLTRTSLGTTVNSHCRKKRLRQVRLLWLAKVSPHSAGSHFFYLLGAAVQYIWKKEPKVNFKSGTLEGSNKKKKAHALSKFISVVQMAQEGG
jgi:hypothetical protein